MDKLPDEILIFIFSHLNQRDICKCSLVNKRWNSLSYTKKLWSKFSLNDIVRPKWCASKLVSLENTNYLIQNRFSQNITRVDLAKLCFSFETLDILFQNCNQIKSLCVNFKYLQIKSSGKYLVSQLDVGKWSVNKLEKLYLKNVCDMKARRYCRSNQAMQNNYDIIELQIIKLIEVLFKLNSSSLIALGCKCVDPNVITSCVRNFENLEILLLNNINDPDSVLSEISAVCKNLKCLELTKCKDFHGDGLQELIEQMDNLETLQIGKCIYPSFNELREINWSILKLKLIELHISTKFRMTDDHSLLSSSPQSVSSTSSSPVISIDLYSKTLFNYLNDDNNLEYLALEDFTLKFPITDCDFSMQSHLVEHLESKRKKLKPNQVIQSSHSNLKYLYLRNIRDVKLQSNQLSNIKSFLEIQYSLKTLDLIGIYFDSDFICSVLVHLNNLEILNFGHGKSYRSSSKLAQIKHRFQHIYNNSTSSSQISELEETNSNQAIDIDSINSTIAQYCSNLKYLGIFYRQSELKFKKDPYINFKNDELMNLFIKCKYMKQISYLKSFKLKDEDEDVNIQDFEENSKYQNYFHFIRYAIQNASNSSVHINMNPCYGFDLSPSASYLLESNGDIIETSLPIVEPPRNDFHHNLLSV